MIHLNKPTEKENGQRTKVLLIDDEASFTRMLKLTLESTGNYEVLALNESPKAVQVAKDFLPDIILLDVVMPETDGGDVAQNLRSRTATKNIPIIFISAMVSSRESKNGFYESGGEHFLAKPIDEATVCGAIETVLASH